MRAARPILRLFAWLLPLVLLPLLAPSVQAQTAVATGSYTGDGTTARDIFVGFEPAFVIVKAESNFAAEGRVASMANDESRSFTGGSSSLNSDAIRKFKTTAFKVGSHENTNKTGEVYYWTAFDADPADMVVGTYRGTGDDNQLINGFGLTPTWVIVFAKNMAGPVHYCSLMPNDESYTFDWGQPVTNRIQSLTADGMILGDNDQVNKDGDDYHYVAWRSASATRIGTYTGDGTSSRSIATGGPPAHVFLQGSSFWSAVHRPRALLGNETLSFRNLSKFANGVRSLDPSGFTVGNTMRANGSGLQYYYSAFHAVVVEPVGVDLAVSLAVDDDRPSVGDTLTVQLGVANIGTGDATAVEIRLDLPNDLVWIESLGGDGSYDEDVDEWSIASLVQDDTATFEIRVRVDEHGLGQILTMTASLQSSLPPDQTSDNDDASRNVMPRGCDLEVTKIVDDTTPNEGDTVTYSIEVYNAGPDTAFTVQLQDALPSGLTLVTADFDLGGPFDGGWRILEMLPSQVATGTITATVDTGTAGTSITNTVASTVVDPLDIDSSNNSDSATVDVQLVDIGVTKRVTPAGPVEGETVTFTITVRNFGPDAATGVAITDLLPVGLEFVSQSAEAGAYTEAGGLWAPGAIAADDSVRLTIEARVSVGAPNEMVNTAALTAVDQTDADSANDSGSATVTLSSADVTLVKDVDSRRPNVGDIVTFTVTLTNQWDRELLGLEVTDELPAGLLYVSHSADNGSYDSDTGVWSLAGLDPDSPEELRISAQVDTGTGGQTLVNQADLTAGAVSEARSDTAAVTVQSADLFVSISATPEEIAPGESTTLVVTLPNTGPSDASNVVLRMTIPDGLALQSASPSAGTYDSDTQIWSVATIAASTDVQLTLVCQAGAGTFGQTFRVVADVTGTDQEDPTSDDLQDFVDVSVPGADLVLTKTVDNISPTTLDPATFSIVVRNDGPNTATSIVVEDILPIGLVLQNSSVTDGSYNSGTGLWSLSSLASGGSETLSLTVVLADGVTGNITNTARIVSFSPEDPDPSNNTDTATVGSSIADLSVSLSVDDRTPFVGDEILLTISVANDGPESAPDVKVHDLLDSGFSVLTMTPGQGTYSPGDGVWSVGTLGAGETSSLILRLGVGAALGGSTILNDAHIHQPILPDPDTSNDADDVEITTTALVDLALTSSASPLTTRVGDSVARVFVLTNEGPSPATNVTVQVTESAEFFYESHGATGGSYAPASGVWNLGTLFPGSSAQLTLTGLVLSSAANSILTELASVATVSEFDDDASNDNTQFSVTVTSPLSVSAFQTEASLLPGADATQVLRLVIENPSAFAETLSTVSLVDGSTGLGGAAEIASNWTPIDLEFNGTSHIIDAGDPGLEWTGLSQVIPAAGTLELLLKLGAGLDARDADEFDASLDVHSFVFTRPIPFSSAWPLDPAGVFTVDGRSAAQMQATLQEGGTLVPDTTGVVVANFLLTRNGYEDDTLQALHLRSSGTARVDEDIAVLKLWVDGGDGLSDLGLGDDSALGTATATLATDAGGTEVTDWTLSGLGLFLSELPSQIFATVDLAATAREGRSFEFSLPLDPVAVDVQSGNDGPNDLAVSLSEVFSIRSASLPSLTARVVAVPSAVVEPGGGTLPILVFELTNDSALDVLLQSVVLADASTGGATEAQFDASWSNLILRLSEADDTGDDVPATMLQGQLRFRELPWSVPALGSLQLTVEGGASLLAADGDHLGLEIVEAASITFRIPTTLAGDFPLANAAGSEVDGMAVAQIRVDEIPTSLLEAGSLAIPVFRFRVPPNGYLDDTLESVRLVNLGTADEADIDRVQLWKIDTPTANATARTAAARPQAIGGGTLLGDAEFVAGVWTLSALSEAVSVDGLWIEVTVDLHPHATAAATMQFSLPAEASPGLSMSSANDGPHNEALTNAESLIIGSGHSVIEVSGTGAILSLLTPGGEPSEILEVTWINQSADADTLLSLTFESGQSGPGTATELAANWSDFELHWMGEDEPVIAVGRFEDGRIHFDNLNWSLPPVTTRRAVLYAAATLSARDTDFLDPRLEETGIVLARDTELSAAWPVDPVGWFEVDGMVVGQLALHPLDAAGLAAGSVQNLALHVHIPANGYTTDVLEGFNLNVLGTVQSSDLAGMDLWVSDGVHGFDPNSDRWIGSLQDTGNRWEVTGLAEPVPLEGLHILTTVDISPVALESRTFRLEVPGERTAITLQSGNDGPWDEPLTNPVTQIISSPDRITLSAFSTDGGLVNPGGRVRMLSITGTNTYEETRTLTELTLRNTTVGVGDEDQLDEQIEIVGLFEDTNGDGSLQVDLDRLIGSSSFTEGTVTFRNLEWTLLPHVSRDLFIMVEVSGLLARDGDVLSLELREPLDVVFSEQTTVVGNWPLGSGSGWTVEGMVADQIGTESAAVQALGPGQQNAVVFDFSLPANGYEDDVLRVVKLRNRGTAGPADIAALKLWSDSGDGEFSVESDVHLGEFFWTGALWQSPDLSTPLAGGSNRFFVSLDVDEALADSATVRLEIPVAGIEVNSGNDGPIDEAVVAPSGALLSTAPLLATIMTSPSTSNVDQFFSVHMQVKNQMDEVIAQIVPEIGLLATSTQFEWIDGPTPTTMELDPGETGEFVWNGRGTVPGTVEFVGRAVGSSSPEGAERSSLSSEDDQHQVLVRASDLQLFALASFPVSLNYGQVGVVPFSLTFKNPGEENSSDIELREIRVHLEDELGADVAPSDLIERVIVNEGTRIYLRASGAGIESEGSVLILPLQTPVRISALEPTTLNLRFDLKETSPVQSYRVMIPESSWFDAVDATSQTAVDITLQNNSFPIVSGLAQLVSEAVAVEVTAEPGDPVRVSPGQDGVELWSFDLLNRGDGSSFSDVRVGSFALTFRELEGTPVSAVADIFDALWIESPLQTVVEMDLHEVSGDSMVVLLTRPLNLPVDAPVTLTIRGQFAHGTHFGSYRFELEDSQSFDIRDANTGSLVPARYEPSDLAGSEIRIESRADRVVAFGSPVLPEKLGLGHESVLAIDATVQHPGDELSAGVEFRSWTVQLWNDDRSELQIADYIDRLWLTWNGTEIGSVSPNSDRSDAVIATNVRLNGGDLAGLQLWVDIEAAAPTGSIELFILAAGIDAVDTNTGLTVEVTNEKGGAADLYSGLSTLRMPARALVVEFESQLPATLVADGGELSIGTLHLVQPDEGVGPVAIDRLAFRSADANGTSFPMKDVVERVRAYRNGVFWAESVPALDDPVWLAGEQFFVSETGTEHVEIKVVFRQKRKSDQVRFGVFEEDVSIVQPSGAADQVEPRAKAGDVFPLWTDTGNFGSTDLAASYVNFPNPFAAGREETAFAFYLEDSATATLRIWTTHGDEVRTLVEDAAMTPGLHQGLTWDGRNGRGDTVLSGVYLAELDVKLANGERSRLWRKVAVVR